MPVALLVACAYYPV